MPKWTIGLEDARTRAPLSLFFIRVLLAVVVRAERKLLPMLVHLAFVGRVARMAATTPSIGKIMDVISACW